MIAKYEDSLTIYMINSFVFCFIIGITSIRISSWKILSSYDFYSWAKIPRIQIVFFFFFLIVLFLSCVEVFQ